MQRQNEQKVSIKYWLDNEKFSVIFDKSPIPSSLLKLPGFKYAEVNASWCDFYGIAKEEAIGRTPEELKIIDLEILERQREILHAKGSVKDFEFTVTTRRGEKKDVFASIEKLSFGDESIIIVMLVDITERKKAERGIVERQKLENQLRQAQKMEAVGRLAGGVAHDFNNMLSLIIGYTELAMLKTAADNPIREELEIILEAGRRSSDITSQLLGFARKQTIAPKILDLNETVGEILGMFRRLIGEDIELVWLPADDLWNVKIDPSQIDQVLVNLCVNAKDAFAGAGKITIETENVVIDQVYCEVHEGFVPGEFVMLAVSDTGCGMGKETLEHIFEPFFTTKGVGKGTGLGLSTIYGIVKQNNGFINAYSEIGKGTTFKIYIPRHQGEPNRVESKSAEELPLIGRGETLLIVEDEVLLLELAQRILAELDYTVLTANTPNEAIKLVEAYPGKIDLLVTDVVLPVMDGKELSERIKIFQPGIRYLFMSGYTANAIAQHGVLDEGVHFIQKPFSHTSLAAKVREALEED